MGNPENFEWENGELPRGKKEGTQNKLTWELWECLGCQNIKDITKWIVDTPQGRTFKSLHPSLAEKLEGSKDINEYKSNLWHIISSILFNTGTIQGYLNDVEIWKPTWDIEYHIKLVKEWLKKLEEEKGEDPIYKDFISVESSRFKKVEVRVKNTIWKRKRGENGIYQ